MSSPKNDQIKDKYTVLITDSHDGQRIDNYLMGHYKGVPKSRLYRALRKGEVRLNKKRCRPTDRIHAQDLVRLPPLKTRDSKQPLPKDLKNDLGWLKEAILYEDDGLIVLNKPAGLAVHGGTGVGVSLMPLLALLYPEQYLRLVHRIDRATSGCLLIARNRSVLLAIQAQFREHAVEKNYCALCYGVMHSPTLPRKSNLTKIRDGATGVRMVEGQSGQLAESLLKREQTTQHLSKIAVTISTGRMHQIRVHCAQSGLPILGDSKYGNKATNAVMAAHDVKRMFLHAHELTIDYAGEKRHFVAPLPEAFNKLATYDAWFDSSAK